MGCCCNAVVCLPTVGENVKGIMGCTLLLYVVYIWCCSVNNDGDSYCKYLDKKYRIIGTAITVKRRNLRVSISRK